MAAQCSLSKPHPTWIAPCLTHQRRPRRVKFLGIVSSCHSECAVQHHHGRGWRERKPSPVTMPLPLSQTTPPSTGPSHTRRSLQARRARGLARIPLPAFPPGNGRGPNVLAHSGADDCFTSAAFMTLSDSVSASPLSPFRGQLLLLSQTGVPAGGDGRGHCGCPAGEGGGRGAWWPQQRAWEPIGGRLRRPSNAYGLRHVGTATSTDIVARMIRRSRSEREAPGMSGGKALVPNTAKPGAPPAPDEAGPGASTDGRGPHGGRFAPIHRFVESSMTPRESTPAAVCQNDQQRKIQNRV